MPFDNEAFKPSKMVVDLLTLGYFVRQPTDLSVGGTYTNPPHGFSRGKLMA